MAKGFFKERKHYTLQNIADILYEKENADLEETRRLVGILKKYGVVKAVKRTKPEFDDLSNEDIVLTDVVDNSSDIEYVFDYVGVVMLEGHVFKCYPKYIETKDEPFEELKKVLKVIKKYNSSEQLIYLFNGEDDSRIFNRLAVALHLLDPYEKETYGSMVAEDIGDSYVRCGQIADAAIEIEKIIKDLSEQELQDEKVVKVILKKCFENKEDIGSMAEGMCLEMLTEKVMELVRDLYL